VSREILARPTLQAARSLLGARLVRDDETGRRVGRVVEVEAYGGPEDRASHARFGRTTRNAVMFGPPGVAYVYLVYGMYHCLNVVTEPAGRAAAILVRAVAPVEGLDLMRRDREARAAATRRRAGDPLWAATAGRRIASLPAERLASGPGLVTAAFGIDRSWTGVDLCDPASALRLESAPPGERRAAIRVTPRIGVAYAGDPWSTLAWRLHLADDLAVSGSSRR